MRISLVSFYVQYFYFDNNIKHRRFPFSSEMLEMQKRPFNKNQVQVLRKMLAENLRDFALLNAGIDTSLRSKDFLHLKVQDIRTAWGEIREQIEVKQKKTGNRVQCLLPQN